MASLSRHLAVAHFESPVNEDVHDRVHL
jgi:hypothetical protein